MLKASEASDVAAYHACPWQGPLGEPMSLPCRIAWVGESMVALKTLCGCLVCLSVLIMLLTTGCAGLGGIDDDPYLLNGAQDYPVTIVDAQFAPASDVDVAASGDDLWLGRCVRVAMEATTSSRVDGALQYAGIGALECGLRSLEAGSAFPLVFVPCAVLAMPVMAVVGAVAAAPEADVGAIEQSLSGSHQPVPYDSLAERAQSYLAAMSERPVRLVPVTTPLQPCSRYFWTVRARFTLDGVRRVTEWAGAYVTAGGEVAPSYKHFYPFRTPAADSEVDCWS